MTKIELGKVYAVYNLNSVSGYIYALKLFGVKNFIAMEPSLSTEKDMHRVYKSEVKKGKKTLFMLFTANRVPKRFRYLVDVFFNMKLEKY